VHPPGWAHRTSSESTAMTVRDAAPTPKIVQLGCNWVHAARCSSSRLLLLCSSCTGPLGGQPLLRPAGWVLQMTTASSCKHSHVIVVVTATWHPRALLRKREQGDEKCSQAL
jgi:hypothetical protein